MPSQQSHRPTMRDTQRVAAALFLAVRFSCQSARSCQFTLAAPGTGGPAAVVSLQAASFSQSVRARHTGPKAQARAGRPGGQASNGKGRAKLERFDPHRFMSRGDRGNHLAPYRGRTAGAQVQFAHLQPALFLCAKDCHSWVWMASRRGDHLIPAVRETLGNMRQSECSGTPLMLGDPLEGVLDGITLSGPFWQPSLISPRDIPTRISQPQL